jgi:hypothetical protein
VWRLFHVKLATAQLCFLRQRRAAFHVKHAGLSPRTHGAPVATEHRAGARTADCGYTLSARRSGTGSAIMAPVRHRGPRNATSDGVVPEHSGALPVWRCPSRHPGESTLGPSLLCIPMSIIKEGWHHGRRLKLVGCRPFTTTAFLAWLGRAGRPTGRRLTPSAAGEVQRRCFT